MTHDADDPDLQAASAGVGPLLQRDYWAVVRDCRMAPAAVMQVVRRRFAELPPAPLVRFEHGRAEPGADAPPLEVGDRLTVRIQAAGRVGVEVTHLDDLSITLATRAGHPEAGRITFGAYPGVRGDVVFHIRSRARASNALHYLGFLAAGDAMQTNTWTDFIDRLAHAVGEGVVGAIQVEEASVEPTEGDDTLDTPTFRARTDDG